MSFKENDRVRITDSSAHHSSGELGTVTHVYETRRSAYRVKLDSGNESGFFESELEFVDPKREALIVLAEALDSARKQANDINGCEGTIYQQITIPLIGVLDALVPVDAVGFDAYEFIIHDGLSVREALKKVEK